MAAACLAAGLAASLLHGRDPAHGRTVLFTTLVLTHLVYAFIARRPAITASRHPTARSGWLGGPWLTAAVAGGLLLQLIVVTWAPAQATFRTVSLTATDWALVVSGATVGLLAVAVHRWISGASEGLRANAQDDEGTGGP